MTDDTPNAWRAVLYAFLHTLASEVARAIVQHVSDRVQKWMDRDNTPDDEDTE